MHNDAFMKTLTVRKVPQRLADALAREKRRRGRSLNQTVLDVLSGGLGLGSPDGRRNGLARLAGTWSIAESTQFEEAIADTELIDDELWR